MFITNHPTRVGLVGEFVASKLLDSKVLTPPQVATSRSATFSRFTSVLQSRRFSNEPRMG